MLLVAGAEHRHDRTENLGAGDLGVGCEVRDDRGRAVAPVERTAQQEAAAVALDRVEERLDTSGLAV